MKFNQLAAASMLFSTFALAACGAEPETVVEAEPEGVPGLSVENARVVLAPVPGNPAAGYFDLKYENDRGLAIRRADVRLHLRSGIFDGFKCHLVALRSNKLAVL